MQTQSEEDEVEETEDKAQTPRASHKTGAWLEEVERERLERELEERNAEIRKLKEELQKNETAPEQVSVANWAVTETQSVAVQVLNCLCVQVKPQWVFFTAFYPNFSKLNN